MNFSFFASLHLPLFSKPRSVHIILVAEFVRSYIPFLTPCVKVHPPVMSYLVAASSSFGHTCPQLCSRHFSLSLWTREVTCESLYFGCLEDLKNSLTIPLTPHPPHPLMPFAARKAAPQTAPTLVVSQNH